ncbi:penicillin-binding protein 2 [Sphingobacterium spiritivorum]|uniref:Penicillin-binding protein 2 n=1 Tax=Sphingobacterium spiritivorum ATCC 33861 TaxID=525373 RepID=D7VPC4_SPHSI|nr:penicillin-binding protein 2 [Sphingobacterium spiritivorum]EFK57771.1 penicillin-binding protein 2 [Sphingobacterium spiritivorum ATCC 33861]QQT36199.1 penicillin-binding protein 2 [Sphingobacterium spiritivorum]WQD32936.1 penicillin-binding protein 2 [Sphingobacterium spiritivorum]SUJ16385.1 Penicillin-binding protein 2 [Sphingobacterium spiritivorum]
MNSFFARKYVIQGIFIAVAIILIARLFYLQIIDDTYLLSANNNVLRKVIVYPARGVILDRNGKVMVQNEPVYDLLVTPKEVKDIDTALLCSLIDIDKAGFDSRMAKARAHSPFRASQFEKQLSATTYARLQEHLYKFRGFYVQNRTVRSYPDSLAAQFLGYIEEVRDRDIEKSNGFYRPGDYIGASGVERAYEDLLRGKRGVKNLMVDALNRPKGVFMEGKYDTLAVAGDGLISSLDKELQILGEKLMKNKLGSIVAIEPSTGEILAYVSSPSYDPNLMVGRQRGNNYMKLLNDPTKPMFNRPIQASYPPGSVFKVVSALTAQQAGMIDTHTVFNCPGGYSYGGGRGFMRCTHVDGPTSLVKSIQRSCNTYYGYTYARMIDSRGLSGPKAYDLWREATMKFGIGHKLGIDLPGEKPGLLPTSDFYTKRYGNDKWRSSFNISLSIGQGEMGITPLQMANIMAIVANRGFYYRPHLIKGIGDKKILKEEFTEKISAGVDAKYYQMVIEGLSQAVNSPGGTAYSNRINGIEMCGKTGTAQNPHGENHAVFFAFAPRENPKIAIAVFVENAGYGGVWAGPIASMMVEKYVKDTITMPKYIQDRIYNASFMPKKEIPKPKKEDVKKDSTKTKAKTVQQTAAIKDDRKSVLVHHSQIKKRYE